MKVLLIGAKNSPNFEDDYWRQPATRSVPLCVVGTYNRKLFNGKVLSTWAGKVSFDDLLVHQAASDLKQTIENQNKITFWMSHPRIDPKPTWVENIFLQRRINFLSIFCFNFTKLCLRLFLTYSNARRRKKIWNFSIFCQRDGNAFKLQHLLG